MRVRTAAKIATFGALILSTAACGRIGNLFGPREPRTVVVTPDGTPVTTTPASEPRTQGRSTQGTPFEENRSQRREADVGLRDLNNEDRETLFDLFSSDDDPNITLEVNKFIWNAALDILDFMPIQSVDPFSGIIVYGFGTPPGGSRAYRATVYVQDPALDARSLRLALATRAGPAPTETVRAVEDAILTRARQLRIAEGEL